MATATVKLYASLAKYLPSSSEKNAIRVSLPPDATISSVLGDLNLPPAICHLVLVNGTFIPPSQRANHPLGDGDILAAWPPISGG